MCVLAGRYNFFLLLLFPCLIAVIRVTSRPAAQTNYIQQPRAGKNLKLNELINFSSLSAQKCDPSIMLSIDAACVQNTGYASSTAQGKKGLKYIFAHQHERTNEMDLKNLNQFGD